MYSANGHSINPLKLSGNYMYHLIQQLVTLNFPAEFVYVFGMILKINDYFLKQHQPTDLCNGEVLCFLWDTNYIFK
jgi:hypothetical protein